MNTNQYEYGNGYRLAQRDIHVYDDQFTVTVDDVIPPNTTGTRRITRAELDWHECLSFLEGWKGLEDSNSEQSWHGGNRKQLDKMMRDGTSKGLEEAEELLDKIDTDLDIHGMGPEWSRSMIGSSPNVPNFLQGHPMNMNRMVIEESARGVIRVFVCTATSGGVSHDTIYKRGIACVALARALSKFRPVELWAYDNGYVPSTSMDRDGKHSPHGIGPNVPDPGNDPVQSTDVAMLVRISANPIDLSAACAALCTTAFARGFMHNAVNRAAGAHNYHDAGVYNYKTGTYDKSVVNIGCGYETIGWARTEPAALLCLQPQDVLTPPSYHGASEMITDPVGWVQRELRAALAKSSSALAWRNLFEESGESGHYADMGADVF